MEHFADRHNPDSIHERLERIERYCHAIFRHLHPPQDYQAAIDQIHAIQQSQIDETQKLKDAVKPAEGQ